MYPDVPSQQVEVRATKTVNTIFLRALGVGTVQVQNSATAGFGTVPVDAYLTIDATGSMHRGNGTSADPDCNAGETGGAGSGDVCPIKEAKDGATAFVNTLLADGGTSHRHRRWHGRVPWLLQPAEEHSAVRVHPPALTRPRQTR